MIKESLDDLTIEQLEKLNEWMGHRVSSAKLWLVVGLLNLGVAMSGFWWHYPLVTRWGSLTVSAIILVRTLWNSHVNSTDRYIRKLKGE